MYVNDLVFEVNKDELVSFGRMGESTGIKGETPFPTRLEKSEETLRVGDLVVYQTPVTGMLNLGIVIKSTKGQYTLAGHLKDLTEFNAIRILPYHKVSEEIIQHIMNPSYQFLPREVVELTSQEIEEMLGYPVKIVEEED